MSKKLLPGTLKYYLIYSLLVMLCAAPLFYFSMHYLYMEDADEGLLLLKKEFAKNSETGLRESDISVWNRFNRDEKIDKARNDVKENTFLYRTYYDTLYLEYEPYRVLMSPVRIEGKPYTFTARTNLVEKEDIIFSVVWLFVVIIGLLFIGLFVITKTISVRLWKPFYETLAHIEAFEVDKIHNDKLGSNKIEEFSRLNQAINKLTEKNTSIYRSQKEFIENAAHELQTPIAIFRGKIETLLQRSDVTEGQFEILAKLNNGTIRLSRLNKNLLLLSKIGSNQFVDVEEVDLRDIVNSQLAFFTEQALAKNITINTEYGPKTKVQVNHFLAETLISNLFLNAIRHNMHNGRIDVILDSKALVFSNAGSPEPMETDKLFERFSKVNPSSKGNGLGLSIIKKITDNNRWKIIYNFEDYLHVFKIKF